MKPVKIEFLEKSKMRLGNFNRPIFIVGLPRSGTSLVAGLLSEFGGWTGDTVPGTGENPKGFFENNELRKRILWPALRALGGDSAGVMKLPPVDANVKFKIPDGQRRIPMRLAMKEIVQNQGYTGKKRWVYKAPKMTLLWRSFHHAFPQAEWVVVRRSRDGFVNSCIKTSFMAQYSKEPKFWHNMADEYDLRLDQLAKGVNKVYELQAGDILRGDTAALKSMVMKMDGLSFSIAKVRKFVDPVAWHHD